MGSVEAGRAGTGRPENREMSRRDSGFWAIDPITRRSVRIYDRRVLIYFNEQKKIHQRMIIMDARYQSGAQPGTNAGEEAKEGISQLAESGREAAGKLQAALVNVKQKNEEKNTATHKVN